jgi:hypothetical protein
VSSGDVPNAPETVLRRQNLRCPDTRLVPLRPGPVRDVVRPPTMRPRGLEPPRTIQSTRPSTAYARRRPFQRRPARPFCAVWWTRWTDLAWWMFSKCSHAMVEVEKHPNLRRRERGDPHKGAMGSGVSGLSVTAVSVIVDAKEVQGSAPSSPTRDGKSFANGVPRDLGAFRSR